MEDLAALVEANEELAAAIAAAYEILVGGVPNIAGFEFLMENALATNFGAGAGVEFNRENIFINIVNALVQGNPDAQANFAALIGGAASLEDKITALYQALVPVGSQSDAALEFLTRPEALAFFEAVAAERGVAGPNGAAIVALASILNEVVAADTPGIGDATNDLLAAILDGSAQLPASGTDFTPIETADGTNFDADDNIGKVITLTDRVDTPGIDESQPGSGVDTRGTDGNDTYIASDLTLTAGDAIEALGGDEDTLFLNLVNAKITLGDVGTYAPPLGYLGLVVQPPLFEVESTGLENIVIQLEGAEDTLIEDLISGLIILAGGPPFDPDFPIISGAEIDLSRSTGVTDVTIESTAGLVAVNSIQNNVGIHIMESVGIFSFRFDNDALGGAADADLVVDVDGVFAALLFEAQGGEGFGSLTLNTTGSNILMISDNFDSSMPLTSLTVTGTGLNAIVSGLLDPDLAALVGGSFIANEFAGLTSVDLSANSGGTFLELNSNFEDLTYEGGSGNDLTLFGIFEPDFSGPADGALTDDDTVDGGAGYDGLLMSGIDWENLTGTGVTGVEFYGVLTPGSGNPFKFENGDHDVDLGLFVDQGAAVTLEDMDGHEVYVLGPLTNSIIFDDTDDAVITLGIPAEFANYVTLLGDALDELGLEFILPILGAAPIVTTIADIEVPDTETLTFNVGLPSALPFPESTLIVGNIDTAGVLNTILGSGPGDLVISLVTPVTSPDDVDGLVFDMTNLTGGFSFENGLDGAQTFILGALDSLDTNFTVTDYDFDDDGNVDDGSAIDFGAAALDLFQDRATFTSAGFGNLAIENFSGWVANPTLGQQDILDFTALGVNELTDLTFTDVTDGLAITSDAFDGTVLLVGLTAADISNENFDFVI